MYKNILIPVAPDHVHPLSESLDIARKLAEDGARITALTVVEAIPSYAAQYLPDGQLEKTHTEIANALNQKVDEVEGVVAAVISGHSGRTIVEYADEHDVDCIVIASHQPGLQDYFLGSTAARVVRHAQCAVHVIR